MTAKINNSKEENVVSAVMMSNEEEEEEEEDRFSRLVSSLTTLKLTRLCVALATRSTLAAFLSLSDAHRQSKERLIELN